MKFSFSAYMMFALGTFWQTKSECLSDKTLYGTVPESSIGMTEKCPMETNVNA